MEWRFARFFEGLYCSVDARTVVVHVEVASGTHVKMRIRICMSVIYPRHIVTFLEVVASPQIAAEWRPPVLRCWPIPPGGSAPFPKGSRHICARALRHTG